MQTTCLYCGLPTKISPDASRCTECGGDLEALITPEYASEFFYQQAQEQAFQGDAKQALSTIRRGLDEYDNPDLHLLAAILHQRMGEFDQMRAHVAAIPIDDPLRPEGEWLLRSHQARQRGGRRRAVQTNNDTLAMTPFGQPEQRRRAPAQRKRRGILWAAPVMAVLVLFFAGWWTWQNGMLDAGLQQLGFAGIPGLTQNAPVETLAQEPTADPAAAVPVEETALPTPTPLPTTPPPDDVVQNQADEATVAAAPTADVVAESASASADAESTLVSTAVDETTDGTRGADLAASDTTAAEVAEADAAPSPVASSDQGDAAALAALPEINLSLLLTELGAPELSDLPITANRKGSEIVLTGTAQTAEQRDRIMALLATVPGVELVDALNLVVRVADTYTTRPGDSLWKIAEALYGNGRRWREIYDLNQELLGLNPGTLYSNIELQLPPVQ